ncbi:MAG TPA: hypothetical protein VG965_06865 [Patescibacteria group bacterium]|nr:hypothetical protein [Patescibacteria group bacterium]
MGKESFLDYQNGPEFRVKIPQKIEAPTCEYFEPNFVRVFAQANTEGSIQGNSISRDGRVIARMLSEEQVYDIRRKGIIGRASNAETGPILIKNPSKTVRGVGERNGLFIADGIAFAVRVTSMNFYATRIVLPAYQDFFVEEFEKILARVNHNPLTR